MFCRLTMSDRNGLSKCIVCQKTHLQNKPIRKWQKTQPKENKKWPETHLIPYHYQRLKNHRIWHKKINQNIFYSLNKDTYNTNVVTIVRFIAFGQSFFALTLLIWNQFHWNLKYITNIKGLNIHKNFYYLRYLKDGLPSLSLIRDTIIECLL